METTARYESDPSGVASIDEPPLERADPFDRIRARVLLPSIYGSMSLVQLTLNIVGRGNTRDTPAVTLVRLLAIVLPVLLIARYGGLRWRQLFGARLTRDSVPIIVQAVPINYVVILMLIAAGSVLITIPLSYVAPQFVERFFLTVPPVFIVKSGPQFLVLCIHAILIAPVGEEVLVRGLLLHRWAHRWGMTTGVVASSALFALGHNEWLGHFVCGAFFAMLYLRTRQLWVPIVVHALNNLLAVVPMGLYQLRHPSMRMSSSLAELHAQLPSAVWKFLLGIGLLVLYVRWYWPAGVVANRAPYWENKLQLR